MTAPNLLLAHQWFIEPITIPSNVRLWMLLPLVFSVAVVYKTIRCRDTREIPAASAVLWVTILLGMFGVGIGLLVVFRVLA